MNIFKFLISWFSGLFTKMSVLYDKFSDDVKNAVEPTSMFIAVLTRNLNATPDVFFNLVSQWIPGVSRGTINHWLAQILIRLNLIPQFTQNSLSDNLKLLQDYLKTKQGNDWVNAVQNVVGIIWAVTLPADTPLQKITFLMQYIYERITKKKLGE